jgi:hypothetical protein
LMATLSSGVTRQQHAIVSSPFTCTMWPSDKRRWGYRPEGAALVEFLMIAIRHGRAMLTQQS